MCRPEASICWPASFGSTCTMAGSKRSLSIGFESVIEKGTSGLQPEPAPQSWEVTSSGPNVRNDHVSGFDVTRVPSAEGVPGPTETVTTASDGKREVARNTTA